jgi:DNA polymerase II small subunit/DNA polymerase delta subunit B
VLPPAGPGHVSEVSLWIHNTTTSPALAVELHGTALLSATGRSIPADVVSLVPDRLDSVAAGSGREVRLRVRVPADQAAATYHGMVLSTAAPAEPMALSLEVRGP